MRKINIIILISALLASAAEGAGQTRRPVSASPRPEQKPATDPRTPNREAQSLKGRVLGEGGRPVQDAAILTIPVNIASNPRGAVTSLLRPVTTDSDGRFEITSLRPGAYTVSAASPGYVLSDADSRQVYRPGDNVTITLAKGAVITGRVTSQLGEPMVGVTVRAIKVRELDNKRPSPRTGPLSEITDSFSAILGPFRTDDRGIYRIYGLTGGVYQVAAGGRGSAVFSLGGSAAFDADAPTYYPSSTLDTASEVEVGAGDEALGIDIRYRDNRGRSISGTVTGSGPAQVPISVILTRAGSDIVEGTAAVMPGPREHGYAFSGLLDGEYMVTAIANSNSLIEAADGLVALASTPRRVTVSGFDVTGVELALEPLASIAGSVVIEPLPPSPGKEGCKSTGRARPEEIVIEARSEKRRRQEDLALGPLAMFNRTTPDEKGGFRIGVLRPGSYHMETQVPGDDLFMKSMTLPALAPNSRATDAAKTGVRLKGGDQVTGLVLTFGEGAAGLKGRVVVGEQDKSPSEKLRLFLVPAEPEAADQVLRYFETEVAADGSFALTNLPPGQYWIVAREAPDQAQSEDTIPLAWDSGGRIGLRSEGQAAKKVVELGRCQRVTDFVLKYVPLIKPSKPSATKP